MALSASTTFDVQAAATVSAEAAVTVLPAVGYGTGGKGRIVHPSLGILDYYAQPDETDGLDGDVIVKPLWSRQRTIGGQIDTLWNGFIRDAVVVERWINGDVGSPLNHARALYQMFMNPPSPDDGMDGAVLWAPSYATARTYRVVLADLRIGGEGYSIDWILTKSGPYTPSPVELELRILGYAD